MLTNIDVEDVGLRLQANFADNRHLVLFQGERIQMDVSLHNTGNKPISELWMLPGPYDQVWVNVDEPGTSSMSNCYTALTALTALADAIFEAVTNAPKERFTSTNSLSPRKPFQIPLDIIHSSDLNPGESINLSLTMHAARAMEQDLSLLFAFREVCRDMCSLMHTC